MNDVPHWVVKSQSTTCPSRAAPNIFPSQHKLWSAESPEDKKEYLDVRIGYNIIKPKQIFNTYINVLFKIFLNDVDFNIFYVYLIISQAPPADQEACELEPLKATVVVR
jgi:hypothetical protein